MSPTRCTKNAIGEGSFMAQFGEGKKNGYVTKLERILKQTGHENNWDLHPSFLAK
jgi:hypothetical protein